MTPQDLWDRYAAIWSLPSSERLDELIACVADDVTYCDPSSKLDGREALSGYMGGFQSSVPGGRFVISSVIEHHGRMLAHWTLLGPDGSPLQHGASYAMSDDQGRLRHINGFFPIASQ